MCVAIVIFNDFRVIFWCCPEYHTPFHLRQHFLTHTGRLKAYETSLLEPLGNLNGLTTSFSQPQLLSFLPLTDFCPFHKSPPLFSYLSSLKTEPHRKEGPEGRTTGASLDKLGLLERFMGHCRNLQPGPGCASSEKLSQSLSEGPGLLCDLLCDKYKQPLSESNKVSSSLLWFSNPEEGSWEGETARAAETLQSVIRVTTQGYMRGLGAWQLRGQSIWSLGWW